jgi:hypothetical protein
MAVGDTMDFTLVNGATIPHSMDFHAAEIAPDRAYRNVMPRDSVQFRFVARVPGVFMYHCGTAPVATHIANGMYGALIVDPRTPRSPAQEFVLVQSEFYLSAPSGPDSIRSMNWDKVLNASPDYVVFNGVAARYATHPIPVGLGKPIRLFVVNAGPNRISSFHVVGAIFDRVIADGFGRPFEACRPGTCRSGGGAIFELRLGGERTLSVRHPRLRRRDQGRGGRVRAGSGGRHRGALTGGCDESFVSTRRMLLLMSMLVECPRIHGPAWGKACLHLPTRRPVPARPEALSSCRVRGVPGGTGSTTDIPRAMRAAIRRASA